MAENIKLNGKGNEGDHSGEVSLVINEHQKQQAKEALIAARQQLELYYTNTPKDELSDSDTASELEFESKKEKSEDEVGILDDLAKKIRKTITRFKREDKSAVKETKETADMDVHELLRVGWYGYMYYAHGYGRGEIASKKFAVLVLHGRVKHFTDYAREMLGKGMGYTSNYIRYRDDAKPSNTISDYHKEQPTIVHINSQALASTILSITGSFDNEQAIFWPFKILQYYGTDFRNNYKRLKEKYEHTLDNLSASSTFKVPEPEKEDVDSLRDLQCLIEFMDKDLKPIQERLAPGNCQKVKFEELWFIFAPGEFAFAPVSSKLRAKIRESSGQVGVTEGAGPLPFLNRPNERYQEYWRILHTTGGRPINFPPDMPDKLEVKTTSFTVRCYYIDFDGVQFFPKIHDFKIDPFEGERAITSFEIFPSRFVPNADQIIKEASEAKQKYQDFAKFKMFYYVGYTLIGEPCGCLDQEKTGKDELKLEDIDSAVIVDFGEAMRNHPSWRPIGRSLEPLNINPSEVQLPRSISVQGGSSSSNGKVQISSSDKWGEATSDFLVDIKMMEDFILSDNFLRLHQKGTSIAFGDLREVDIALLPTRIFAFILRSRKFALLDIRNLRSISPQEQGFARLKLPPGHKQMVQSLVIHHMNEMKARATREDDFEYDIVRGKGKGLIVLLHGAPGVGKTSTAECVAEASGKPLLSITCGDLGSTASKVEEELDKKFHLAQRWNCVLLLDEADVFLTQRTRNDINHNSLVSVFLRVLEYYTGILFLTTNRVGTFDSAFKSRIHISLYYPPLGRNQTRDIWQMNLDQLSLRKRGQVFVDPDRILRFVDEHYTKMKKKNLQWNGRQIRNAVQTAVALAEYEYYVEKDEREHAKIEATNIRPPVCILEPRHFDIVALAAEEFDDHIMAIYGVNEADRAFHRMDRADKMSAINLFKSRARQTTNRSHSSFEDDVRHQWEPEQSYDSSYMLPEQQRQQRPRAQAAPYSRGYDDSDSYYTASRRDQDFESPAPRNINPSRLNPETMGPQNDRPARTPESTTHYQGDNSQRWNRPSGILDGEEEDEYKWGDML